MEAHFAALNKRQTMLLLTAVTFGGQGALEAFAGLPEGEQALLTQRAQALLAVPRERRIPLLVQEIKRLVTARRSQLWSTDPERLAALLKKERPSLVEVVLRALPAGMAAAVRGHLLEHPPVKLDREVRPEVLNLIRWKLEVQLAREGKKAGFKFSDVVLLRTREVVTVVDRLGARALAPALAALPEPERNVLLEKLLPDQRSVCADAACVPELVPLPEPEARALLATHGIDKGPSEALRSAGCQRLVRAALAQSVEFAQRLAERHPGELGALLTRWMRDERLPLAEKSDGGRAELVAELERLAVLGVVDRPVRLPSAKRPEGKAQVPAASPSAVRHTPLSRPAEFPAVEVPPMLGPPKLGPQKLGARREAGAERSPSHDEAPGRPPRVSQEIRSSGLSSGKASPPAPDRSALAPGRPERRAEDRRKAGEACAREDSVPPRERRSFESPQPEGELPGEAHLRPRDRRRPLEQRLAPRPVSRAGKVETVDASEKTEISVPVTTEEDVRPSERPTIPPRGPQALRPVSVRSREEQAGSGPQPLLDPSPAPVVLEPPPRRKDKPHRAWSGEDAEEHTSVEPSLSFRPPGKKSEEP